MSINNKDDKVEKKRRLPQICTFKGNLETYKITDTLQDSLYGKVYQGYGEDSGKLVAIKVLSKNDITTKEMNRLLPETPLAEVFFADEMANHEYLATIRDVFETEDSHCIVSDLADGEDLLELLRKNRYGLSEDQTKICIKQAAIALSKCHERGFALQDFSLENCLLYSVNKDKDLNDENQCENVEMENNDETIKGEMLNDNNNNNNNNSNGKIVKRKFQIKVCDPGQAVRFGRYSQEIEMPVPYLGCVGKKFRPPEIFAGKPYIASKVDSWCLGWSTFYLLFGTELFESVHNIDNDIRWQWYSMGYRDYLYSYLGVKEKLSIDARSFIESLVHSDPIHRMSIKEALNHPFLRDVNENENLILEDWGRPLYDEFKNSLKIEKNREYIIPFIPKVYKTKYLNLYCTGDKPSGYFPINYENNNNHKHNHVRGLNNSKLLKIQNQKSVNNNAVSATARSNNNNNNNNGQNSIGLTSIFQKRRIGKGSAGSTSSLNGRVVMNNGFNSNNNNSQQKKVSINQNQVGNGLSAGLGMGGIMDVRNNPKLLYYQGQYQQQSCYQNYYGYGYNAYYGSGYTSGIGPFHSQCYVVPPLGMGDTTRMENNQKVSVTQVKGEEAKKEIVEENKKKNINESIGSELTNQSSLSSNRNAIATLNNVTSTNIENNTSTATTSPSIVTPNFTNVNSSTVSSNKEMLTSSLSSTSTTAVAKSSELNNGLAGRLEVGGTGVETRTNPIVNYQRYGGLSTMGGREGYSSSYVPAPKVGMATNMQQLGFGKGITSGIKMVPTTSSTNTNTNGFLQNVKNFSYVPPPLTSRYSYNNNIGGVGNHQHLLQNNYQQMKNVSGRGTLGTVGGVSTRLNFGSVSYVPPIMRR